MDESSIITQVRKDECQQLSPNGTNASTLTDTEPQTRTATPIKKHRQRQRGSFFSTLFCCFGGQQSAKASFQQKPAAVESRLPNQNNTASVIHQATPNNNQNTLSQCYTDNEEEDEIQIDSEAPAESFYLLPAIRHQDINKKCVVIDLDETLVHSSFKPVDNPDFIVPVEIDGIVHEVYVLKRPYVDEFLKRMGEIFECVLFTASLAKYANPVADLLDKTTCFRSRLFRESCVYYKGNYVKDLSKLGRDLHNVVIIDNSPASYIFHPENAVPVTTWFDDPNDTELNDLIPFLESISSADNCITALQNNYSKYKNSLEGGQPNHIAER